MASRLRGRAGQRLRALVLDQFGNRCHLCGGEGADTIDHLIPLAHGGTNAIANLRPAHKTCNSARGARPLSQLPVVEVDEVARFFDHGHDAGHPAQHVQFPQDQEEKR